jgi:hypothetical protein
MVAVISFLISLGSNGNRVAFGLIRTISSKALIAGGPVAVKSCRSFGKDLKLEEGLDATGFRAEIFS